MDGHERRLDGWMRSPWIDNGLKIKDSVHVKIHVGSSWMVPKNQQGGNKTKKRKEVLWKRRTKIFFFETGKRKQAHESKRQEGEWNLNKVR